jgi:DNA-directed RNA polymerase specialized sigma24 family protein
VPAAASAGPTAAECPFSPEELLRRLAAGDAPAWEWLYSRYGPMVYAVAVRKLRESEARDVVQTVFVEVLRVLQQGARIDYLGGFLHKVAVRRTLDALKRRLTDENRNAPLDGSPADADEESRGGRQRADPKAEAPEARAVGDERDAKVRRLTEECFEGLSAPERMAAELLVGRMRGDHEKSWAEIRDEVKARHGKTINLARVFEKFRSAFSRHWKE